MRIKITADSTCDLPKALLEKYDISLSPLTIVKDGESFLDNVTITPDEIFAHVAAGGSLCSTAACNVSDYMELFPRYAESYDGVLHISLGSGFSSSYQNACLAAEDFDNVKVVDSQNLSTGQALVVMYACKLAQSCEDLEQLRADVQAYTERVEASFLLNRLDYMVKGGRCSAAAALGANLLNLKPCIEVKNGKMGVVKKYRGNYAKCLSSYVKDRLDGRDDLTGDLLFITYTTVSDDCRQAVLDAVGQYGHFEDMVECTAGCTVSCHCGPETLGILFVRK